MDDTSSYDEFECLPVVLIKQLMMEIKGKEEGETMSTFSMFVQILCATSPSSLVYLL